MFDVLGGHIVGEAAQVSIASSWQTGGIKRRNGVWVCRVSEVVVRAARDSVDDIGVDLKGAFAGAWNTDRSGWVEVVIVCGCDLLPGYSSSRNRREEPACSLNIPGAQLKPNCGPKFIFCACHSPIPVFSVIPVKKPVPLPKTSTPMWLSLSVSGPK